MGGRTTRCSGSRSALVAVTGLVLLTGCGSGPSGTAASSAGGGAEQVEVALVQDFLEDPAGADGPIVLRPIADAHEGAVL